MSGIEKGEMTEDKIAKSAPWYKTRAGITVLVIGVVVAVLIIITTSVLLTREQPDPDPCEEYEVVTREEWGAKEPVEPPVSISQTNMTFLHHTAGTTWACTDKQKCIEDVKSIQDLHVDGNGWNDIGYNFLVGEDGRVYEGRGWLTQGAHAPTYNSLSHGICIIGNFMERMPDMIAMDTARALMRCGVQKGYIKGEYELFGHKDGRCTLCPGDLLYADLQGWPHYSKRQIPVYCPSK